MRRHGGLDQGRTTRKPLNHYTMMCLRERTHKISGGSPSSKTGPVRNNLRPKVLILILGARNFKMRISPLKDSDFTDDNTLAASRKQSQLIKHPKNPNASFGWGKNRTKIIPNGFFLDLICSFSFFSKLVHHFSLALLLTTWSYLQPPAHRKVALRFPDAGKAWRRLPCGSRLPSSFWNGSAGELFFLPLDFNRRF